MVLTNNNERTYQLKTDSGGINGVNEQCLTYYYYMPAITEKTIIVRKEEATGDSEVIDSVNSSPFNGWIPRRIPFTAKASGYKVCTAYLKPLWSSAISLEYSSTDLLRRAKDIWHSSTEHWSGRNLHRSRQLRYRHYGRRLLSLITSSHRRRNSNTQQHKHLHTDLNYDHSVKYPVTDHHLNNDNNEYILQYLVSNHLHNSNSEYILQYLVAGHLLDYDTNEYIDHNINSYHH